MRYSLSKRDMGKLRLRSLENLGDSEVFVVEDSCARGVRLCSQTLQKYTFSLEFMNSGIGNLFSGMLVDIPSKCLFECTQLAGKLDILP